MGDEIKRYKFGTLQELVDRVPADRIRDCLEELGTVLGSAKATAEMVEGVARNLAETAGKPLPAREGSVFTVPPEFEWIDDGKRELGAELQDAHGKTVMSVQINKADSLAEPTGSPTWLIVLDFAKRMEAKLEKNRHKGDREGWLADDIDDLLERLREELCELDNAICQTNGNTADAWMAKQIANEAADVANFAMFIADWYLHRAHANEH